MSAGRTKLRRRISSGARPSSRAAQVDGALDEVDRLGPPRAAIRVHRHGVGQHAADVDPDRRNAVRARQHVDGELRNVGRVVGEVRAHVGVGRNAKRQKACVPVEREFDDRVVVAALHVGEERLAAVRGPAHRALQFPRCPHHDRLFRMQEDLHPERAADVARDHAQLLAVDLQDHVGDLLVDDMRALRRRMKRRAAGRGVVVGQRGARLDRVGDDAVVHEFEPRDVRGTLERRVDRLAALARADVEREVVGDVVPHLRRASVDRAARVDDRRQRVVVDAHAFGGVLRLGERLRHHHRHRIADVPHAIGGENRAWRVGPLAAVLVGHRDEAWNEAETVGLRVGAGQHGEHAGHPRRLGGVDAGDARVRVRRPDDRRVRGMGEMHVVGIAARALQQRGVFDAGDGLSGGESGHGGFRERAKDAARARTRERRPMLASLPYNDPR